MSEQTPRMRSIWFFVGLMLLVMGGLVLAAGVTQLLSTRLAPTVFGRLQPALWWGALMMASGAVFLLADRRADHE